MARSGSPLSGFSFTFAGCLYSSRVESVSDNRGGGPLNSIRLYRRSIEISFLSELGETESVVENENRTNMR